MNETERANEGAQNTRHASRELLKRSRTLVLGTIALGGALILGTALWAGGISPLKNLPDLLGTQRPLPPGTLHVEDLTADIKNYKGTILVRGVMAVASSKDSTIFAMIDSREARTCQDLHCAKHYLPVKTTGTIPKPWDEVDVRGTVVSDGKMTYVQADNVENLGTIK